MYQRQAASIKLKAKRLNTALKTKATVGLNKNFLLTFYNHMQPSSKQSLENSPSKLQPSGVPSTVHPCGSYLLEQLRANFQVMYFTFSNYMYNIYQIYLVLEENLKQPGKTA